MKCGKTYTVSDKQMFTGRCSNCSSSDFSISRLTESTPKCYTKSMTEYHRNSISSPGFDSSSPFPAQTFFSTPTHVTGSLSPITTLNPMFTGLVPGLTPVSSRANEKMKFYGQYLLDEHSQGRQLWPGVSAHGY